jgi:hypothetical protein
MITLATPADVHEIQATKDIELQSTLLDAFQF